jgi:hypothetical protein
MFSFKSKKKPTLQDFQQQVDTIARQSTESEHVKGAGGLLFRVAYNTHLSLTEMADRKAHLMIVVNIFLLTLLITKKHEGLILKYHSLLIPNIFLALMSLTTIIIATLVTRPRLAQPAPDRPPEAVNWIFFGDFCHYPLDTFHKNIWDLIHNDRRLYATLSRDLYWMGVALSRKFRLLHVCYTIFYYGLLITAAAYAIAVFRF